MKAYYLILLLTLLGCYKIDNEKAVQYIELSQKQYGQGKLREAYRTATTGLKKYPKSSVLRKIRGIIWMDYEDFDKARAEFYEAIRLNPNDVEAYYLKAYTLYALEKYDQALIDIEYCIQIDANYYDYVRLKADILFEKEDYLQAEDLYLRLLDVDTTDFSSRLNLGIALSKLERYQEAIDHFHIISHQDDFAELHLLLAECQSGLNKVDEACAEINKAKALDAEIDIPELLSDKCLK